MSIPAITNAYDLATAIEEQIRWYAVGDIVVWTAIYDNRDAIIGSSRHVVPARAFALTFDEAYDAIDFDLTIDVPLNAPGLVDDEALVEFPASYFWSNAERSTAEGIEALQFMPDADDLPF